MPLFDWSSCQRFLTLQHHPLGSLYILASGIMPGHCFLSIIILEKL